MSKLRVFRHEVIQPLDQSYRLIPLTQGQNAIVDAVDFEWLSQWNWRVYWNPHTRSFYSIRRDNSIGKPIRILMHRLIVGNNSKQIDHKNRNTLDNRRENLRPCTDAQNGWNQGKRKHNTSGFKGIYLRKDNGLWRARIGFNYSKISLGHFCTAEDAARAYDAAAKIHYGEFAVLNFP